MNDEIRHQLPLDEALARVRMLTSLCDARFGTRTDWEGTRARISGRLLGMRFTGSFSVEPHRLHGRIESGLLGAVLPGRSYLRRKLTELLDPARSLAEIRARVG